MPTSQEALLRKVRGLLAKAEDPACTPEEAEAFSTKAEALIAKYAVDTALLADSPAKRGVPERRTIPMEGDYKRPKAALFNAIARPFGVRVVMHGRSYLTAVGFPTDLEAVDILYTSLLLQAGNAMAAGLAAEPWLVGNEKWAFKQSFLVGFAETVGHRLREERKRVVDDGKPGTALVLADRSHEVEAFFADLFPRLGKASSIRVNDGGGYSAGATAARQADIGHTRIGGRRQIA